MNLITAPFTKDSGQKMDTERVKAHSSGRTAANMSAFGRLTRPMAKVDLSMLTVMCMKETGKMIRHMEEVSMNIWTEQSMLETGLKIDSMDTVSKPGQTLLNTKEITSMVKNMGLELSSGQIIQST